MKLDIKGRLRNITFKKKDTLMPLYEAISNANDAIRSLGTSNGEIVVNIYRLTSQQVTDNDNYDVNDIESIEIIDNGIGMDTKNFKAFCTADTTNKEERGGKGNGRFMWLKAFEKAEIKTTYKEGTVYLTREFDFSTESDIDEDLYPGVEKGATTTGTTIKLLNFYPKYRNSYPKTFEAITERIINHFALSFILKDINKIILNDYRENQLMETKVLGDKFNSDYNSKISHEEIIIHDEKFDIYFIRFKSSTLEFNSNKIYYCAKNRVVNSKDVSKILPSIRGKILHNNESYLLQVFVKSSYLDNNVNEFRQYFNDITEEDELELGQFNWNDLDLNIKTKIEYYLRDVLKKQKDDVITKVKEFSKETPELRTIIKHPELLNTINLGKAGNALKEELQLAVAKHQNQFYNKFEELVKDINVKDLSNSQTGIVEKLSEYVSESNDIGKMKLAAYVLYRKTVLELMDKSITSNDEGDTFDEKVVHELIMPMRKNSEEIPYFRQNLWILDERLSFHQYLASDKSMASNPLTSADGGKEPDIIVFDNRLAFSESTEPNHYPITIVEFKKPGINTVPDNPIKQINQYIDKIRKGNLRTIDGKLIESAENPIFYCYLVIDMLHKYRSSLEGIGFLKLPDGNGYFLYNPTYKSIYIARSYSSILGDAKRRNRVFFERLLSSKG